MDCLPQIHVAAIHAEHGYRSFTPGIGAFCRAGRAIVGAGGFRNSIGRGTAYAAGGYQWPVRSLRVGGYAGLATGYRPHPVPFGAMLVSAGHFHLSFIPEIKGKTPMTFGFSFTWGFR